MSVCVRFEEALLRSRVGAEHRTCCAQAAIRPRFSIELE
jgi:hypothetical protein